MVEELIRDCNVKIDTLDARVLAMSEALPLSVRKKVQAVPRNFERNLRETLPPAHDTPNPQ